MTPRARRAQSSQPVGVMTFTSATFCLSIRRSGATNMTKTGFDAKVDDPETGDFEWWVWAVMMALLAHVGSRVICAPIILLHVLSDRREVRREWVGDAPEPVLRAWSARGDEPSQVSDKRAGVMAPAGTRRRGLSRCCSDVGACMPTCLFNYDALCAMICVLVLIALLLAIWGRGHQRGAQER